MAETMLTEDEQVECLGLALLHLDEFIEANHYRVEIMKPLAGDWSVLLIAQEGTGRTNVYTKQCTLDLAIWAALRKAGY